MKLITLNMWGGRVKEPLTEFLRKHRDAGIDVFLFQEIYESNGDTEREEEKDRARVPEILADYVCYLRPARENGFGLGIFVRKDIKVLEEGDTFVHGHKNAVPGEKWWLDVGKNLQYIKVESNGRVCMIFNLHGLWEQTGKTDTPARLKQSEKTVEFMKKFESPMILCGDFNLRPDTESLKMIERGVGLRNLVVDYGVTSTRTSLYTKTEERFADYILASPSIEVKEFKVLPEEVSDHAALYAEFY